MKIKLPISIIIPARNEASRLPALLQSINRQKYIPEEIIVADANSTDETKIISEELGAKVIEGGSISVGRNNGAKVAKTDLFIFIDADSIIPNDDFFKKVYEDFTRRKLNIGSILFEMDEESKQFPSARFFMTMFFILKSISSYLPKPFIEGPGFLISTRSAFEKIGGFLVLKDGVPEDLYFMLSGIKLGLKYKVLHHKFLASGRRYFTFFRAIKALIGIVMGSFLLQSGLHNNKKLVEISTGLYGELGGDEEKRQRIKKALTIGSIGATAAVGIGVLVSIIRKNKSRKLN